MERIHHAPPLQSSEMHSKGTPQVQPNSSTTVQRPGRGIVRVQPVKSNMSRHSETQRGGRCMPRMPSQTKDGHLKTREGYGARPACWVERPRESYGERVSHPFRRQTVRRGTAGRRNVGPACQEQQALSRHHITWRENLLSSPRGQPTLI